MKRKRADNLTREKEYRITFGFSLVASQLIFILLFSFWPEFQIRNPVFNDEALHEFDLDMINITRQPVQNPPSPPSPDRPVSRPDDYIVDDEIDLKDYTDTTQPGYGLHNLPEAEDDRYAVHDNPEHAPSVTRIVEPMVPAEARQANIHAEVMVSFLIDRQGGVEEVSIAEIKLWDGDEFQVVVSIGYGLIEATLNAALKWRFRPAEDNGIKVRAVSRHMFTFGTRNQK
ncbi:MAG: energy transducer TonB [Balneolales bacterium]